MIMQNKTYEFQLPKNRLEHTITKSSFDALMKAKQNILLGKNKSGMSPSQVVADSNTIQ